MFMITRLQHAPFVSHPQHNSTDALQQIPDMASQISPFKAVERPEEE